MPDTVSTLRVLSPLRLAEKQKKFPSGDYPRRTAENRGVTRPQEEFLGKFNRPKLIAVPVFVLCP
jgi:hypothetical protein